MRIRSVSAFTGEGFSTIILVAVLFCLYLAGIIAFSSYALTTLWNFYIPQIIPTIPSISQPLAAGLLLVISLLVPSSYNKSENETLKDALLSLASPYLKVAFALVIHQILVGFFF